MFVQRFAGVRLRPQAVAGVHSLLSMHVAVAPLPEARKPAAHAHVYAPGVFVQTFDALRLRPQEVAGVHSLTSVQSCPSGLVKPVRHAQENEPTEFVHAEFVPHGVPAVHSLMSAQATPLPE